MEEAYIVYILSAHRERERGGGGGVQKYKFTTSAVSLVAGI